MRDEYSSPDLDPDLLERFLKEFSQYSKQRSKHSFTGGEPTVHKDLDGLFAAFRNTGHSLYIVSNGQNEKGVDTVIKNKDVIDYVSISLDAGNAELNDMTRGKGVFDKVIQNTKRYMQNGVEVDFRFVLHDRNVEYIEDTFKLATELGLKRLRFSTMHPIAKEKASELTVTYDKLLGAYRNIMDLKKKYPNIVAGMNTRHMEDFTQPFWPKEMCTPIGGPLNGITLLPDGKILFCCDFVDLSFDYSRYEGNTNPNRLDPVIGDYNVDSLAVIKERKIKRINQLRRRRREDYANGNLTGNRKFICENCKFYHFYE
jgi:MoaA/NifB/PqqE/SkfB family radical SAM enzyme